MSLQNGLVKTTILAGAGDLKIEQHVTGRTFIEVQANIRLIANAPAMYDVLRVISRLRNQQAADVGVCSDLADSVLAVLDEEATNES